jgi:phosphohistidine swiveling domain-containing protein
MAQDAGNAGNAENAGKWFIMQERQGGYWPLGPAAANVIEVLADGMEVVLDDNYKEMFVAFLRRHQNNCSLREAYFALGKKTLARIEEDPEYLPQVRAKFESMMPEFEATYEKFDSASLEKKSNEELWRFYDDYYHAYRRIYPFGEMLPYSIRDSLADKLEDYLKTLLAQKGAGVEKKFGEYYSLLSTPKEKSFATREETGLLRILAEIQGDAVFLKAFASAPKEDALSLLKDSRFARELASHAAAFCWVPFDYGLETWDERHFAGALHDLAAQGFDARKRLTQLEDYYARLGERQSALFDELGVSPHYRALFRVAQDSAFMIDFKKEFFTKSHYALQRLLDEIARRLSFSRTAVRYMLPPEVKTALLNEKLPPDFTNERFERREFNVIYHVAGKRRTLYEGADVERVLEREGFSVRKDVGVVEVKGLCACAGTAVGPAKIVKSAAELAKLEPGDVLVAYQTTPDFVRTMKRAAAIVTNEGGITCHAAIVSRELGVPCVIGTKIATSVFKDGDVLQVKASHGIVRKVK